MSEHSNGAGRPIPALSPGPTAEEPEREIRLRYRLASALGEMPATGWDTLIAKAKAEHQTAEEHRRMPLLQNLAQITADISAATSSLRYMAGEQAVDKQCATYGDGQQSAVEAVAKMLGCPATIGDVEHSIAALKGKVPAGKRSRGGR